jgi:DNA repair protein RecO (recombination protein O)
MALYRDDGVVLRTYKLGEADRIVVFYTRTRGKVRAVAKGVRRTKSKFGARLEPGSIVHLQMYEGRNLDIVDQAETAMLLPLLRSDLERFGRASILLEVIDQIATESESDPSVFKVLTGALTELDRSGNPVVVPAFVARILVLEGVQPMMDCCVHCGTEDELVSVDLSEGGVLCREHRRGEPISGPARDVFRHLFEGRVRHVLETTPDNIVREVEMMASRMIEQHIERRLKSSAVLHQHMHL